MKLRLVSRVIVVALVILVGAVLLIRTQLGDSQASARLQGTDLGKTPAPAFALRDQNGDALSLERLKGKPVVLSFFYTRCADACTLVASKLRRTVASLGAPADQVAWVAISVDPAGDTPEAARQFVARNGLTGKLHYLLGSRAELAPVWNAYHVSVEPARTPLTGGASGSDSTAVPGSIVYTSGIFVLDAQGRERVYLDGGFDPAALAADLKTLLEE